MNIVLDIGNVICYWQPQRLVASVFPHEVEQRVALEAVIQQEDWLDLDRGKLDLDTAIDKAHHRSSLPRAQIAALYHAVPEHLAPIPAMVTAIEELAKAGVPLYILSNMHRHAWLQLQETHDFWQWFRGTLVSCEVGCIKPEPEIFALLCERFQLHPGGTVFFDDMAENVAAAQEFGLRAEQVVDPEGGAALVYKVLETVGAAR
ncbi:MAG: HAD family phosphatase [Gammaproteobacteria bacterium]|nr:HAD family phosphatase [Gammaproteobacteria bacterium]